MYGLALHFSEQHNSPPACLHRFQKVLQHCGGLGAPGGNRINCNEAELRLLRFFLARNAAALRVPR